MSPMKSSADPFDSAPRNSFSVMSPFFDLQCYMQKGPTAAKGVKG
jgi:hypothetical protein